jgi:hypothetical protein
LDEDVTQLMCERGLSEDVKNRERQTLESMNPCRGRGGGLREEERDTYQFQPTLLIPRELGQVSWY